MSFLNAPEQLALLGMSPSQAFLAAVMVPMVAAFLVGLERRYAVLAGIIGVGIWLTASA
ncbi:MAG: hypothetical protein ACFBSD_12640 [Paracoccaceae bacterium]